MSTHCTLCNAAFPVWPKGYSGASGYAITPDGQQLCYPCADKREMIHLREAPKTYAAYISRDGRHVTTWTGGKLGDIVTSTTVRLPESSWEHGSTIQHIRVRDVHGQFWSGRGSPGLCVKLHRAR